MPDKTTCQSALSLAASEPLACPRGPVIDGEFQQGCISGAFVLVLHCVDVRPSRWVGGKPGNARMPHAT